MLVQLLYVFDNVYAAPPLPLLPAYSQRSTLRLTIILYFSLSAFLDSLHATTTTTTPTITTACFAILPCARQSCSRADSQPALLLRFKVSVRLALQLRRAGHGSDFAATAALCVGRCQCYSLCCCYFKHQLGRWHLVCAQQP